MGYFLLGSILALMEDVGAAEPLYRVIRKIRRPQSLRELMAACLRSIYMGDPFTRESDALPELPERLRKAVTLEECLIAGIRCQVYRPTGRDEPLPLLIYMHGGGFVIGCSEDTDYITRMLCDLSQVVVISINYRLAPETVFPGAILDCERVLESVLNESLKFSVAADCVYLAGDSAGANLALALWARLGKRQNQVKGMVLLAPWLDMEVEKYESYNRLAPEGIVFDAAFIGYARAAYVGFEKWRHPQVSPIYCPLLELPPTIVLIGGADPFIDQALAFRDRARAVGSQKLEVKVFAGMPHCFYSFPGLFEEEKACYTAIAEFLARA